MTQHSVLIENVGKKFGLSLRSALKYGLVDSFRRAVGKGKDTTLRRGEFWALQDVNVSLKPGDALGIMGVNGSGKTTLLRTLNGTYSPDAGRVTLRGRVGALIAAGAGFSPMLSGRENVFISGTLLGMTPAEIRKKFDEIVAFADLENFIDMPVRNYSSGMSVRLGFAVAVLGTPEILLVDEVLAVGDIAFQKKCYERIDALRHDGVTILFVSHSPGAVWAVCNKGLFLDKGISSGMTSVEELCKQYELHNSYSARKNITRTICKNYNSQICGTGTCYIDNFFIYDENYTKTIHEIEYGKSFILSFLIHTNEPIDDLIIRVAVDTELYKALSIIDSFEVNRTCFNAVNGTYSVTIKIVSPCLRPGCYSFTPSLQTKSVGVHLFLQHNICQLIVKQSEKDFFYADYRSCIQLKSNFEFSAVENIYD